MKIMVSVDELEKMQIIYDHLTKLTAERNTTATVTPSYASQKDWDFNVMTKMVRYGALKHCNTTGTYYLHPLMPQPPSDYFTTLASLG